MSEIEFAFENLRYCIDHIIKIGKKKEKEQHEKLILELEQMINNFEIIHKDYYNNIKLARKLCADIPLDFVISHTDKIRRDFDVERGLLISEFQDLKNIAWEETQDPEMKDYLKAFESYFHPFNNFMKDSVYFYKFPEDIYEINQILEIGKSRYRGISGFLRHVQSMNCDKKEKQEFVDYFFIETLKSLINYHDKICLHYRVISKKIF